MRGARTPLTTYRIQLYRSFRLGAARRIVPYLHDLGVTDLYASPLTAARAGSEHGYDVVDPGRINPEVGGSRSLASLSGALRRRAMGLLLDIVPNHMAASTENDRWRDLLAAGRRSTRARFFDIDRDGPPPASGDRIVLPVLGRPYRDCLRAGDFRIAHADGGLHLTYGSLRLPLDRRSWPAVLGPLPRIALRGGAGHGLRRALRARLDRINAGTGERPRRSTLNGVLAMQNYRLIHWREAGRLVNYRRFFSVNDLVCLRMEDRAVFEEWHALVRSLARSGRVQGLRIDHIDGLREPGRYLRRLRAACGRSLYLVVEKILVDGERLPSRWPVDGTTGYDFLNMVNGLFVASAGEASLRRIYERFTGDRRRFEDLVYRSKRRLLASDFSGQMKRLGAMFLQVTGLAGRRRGPADRQLLRALEETTACLPVYRTYIDDDGPSADDRKVVRAALRAARRRAPRLPSSAFTAVGRALLPLRGAGRRKDRDHRKQRIFVMRWQQLTGPLMAKGHEDTALYIDHHLISLNDVGGNPEAGGVSTAAFHRTMLERRRRSPLTMNATSTHDTKRGEDVRARIDVLSEIPEEWDARLRQWHRWNRPARSRARGRAVPTPSEEVLIYQTLLGAWPAERGELGGFAARVKAYLVKAAREAKEHTSWDDPDEVHEAALGRFIDIILDRTASHRFLAGFREFQGRIAVAGALNSLAQVVIKATAPGVPDFYQGSELWDLSLVDPDNRRPIDFSRRRALLTRLRRESARDRPALLRALLATPLDPRIKLYTTWQSLQLRRQNAGLFLRGRYLPLEVAGARRETICAFARRLRSTWAITVAPRFRASRIASGESLLQEAAVVSGAIGVPDGAPRIWRNVLTGETVRTERGKDRPVMTLAGALAGFPVALLIGRDSTAVRRRRTA